jgi:hypothetical protein
VTKYWYRKKVRTSKHGRRLTGALSIVHLIALVNGEQRGSVGSVNIKGKILFSEAH